MCYNDLIMKCVSGPLVSPLRAGQGDSYSLTGHSLKGGSDGNKKIKEVGRILQS